MLWLWLFIPLLLRQFQEAPAPSKVGTNGTGK